MNPINEAIDRCMMHRKGDALRDLAWLVGLMPNGASINRDTLIRMLEAVAETYDPR